MPNLVIKNLSTKTAGKSILEGLNLVVKTGETHAIMGPNGSGKSTLAYTVMGHPSYEVTGGSITFGTPLNELAPDERSHLGIFLSFQNPQAIAGVKISTMLRTAVNAHREKVGEKPLSVTEFLTILRQNMDVLEIPHPFASRAVNDGFSGGERKRLEILQALMLKPKLLILDEVDSGLDIDAIKVVAKGVNQLKKQGTGVLVITHYQRILNYIKADAVHILSAGAIVKSGDMSLVEELERSSYQAIISH